MKKISIDIETISAIDLKFSGVYRYAEDDSFEILLFAYSVDEGEVYLIDLAHGEKIPVDIIKALSDNSVEKWAFNAQFERVCLSNHLGQWLSPKGWHCSMVWSATLGLPLSLDSVGAVLGLDKQKFSTGKALINYFCKPCSPTKTNGGRIRNLPQHDTVKWQQFKDYNVRDVETEQEVQRKLEKFPAPPEIWAEYWLDQQINDLGIAIDQEFVRQAIATHEQCKTQLTARMVELTGLENPNSIQQLSGWLNENGLEMTSLDKKSVEQALKMAEPLIAEVLRLRQQLSKSSVKKYTAMENCVCKDSRAHGMFQFYGANRTGRWAGRLVQLQNLAQNHMTDLCESRSLVRTGDFESVSMLYDNIPVTLSELIRTAFVPRDGSTFLVADFSAIEARVIAWLAGENWRMKVFAEGGDIYCASASQMFNVPVEKHGQNSHLRQKGKQAELACGYGGSIGALESMGALDYGMKEEELQPLVYAWRDANPNITKLWWDVDKAAKDCVKLRATTQTHGIKFSYKSGFMFITLPSGRKLAYVRPRIGENKFGGECVTYEGVGENKKWLRLDSYGPKFVENIVQAIARDLLMYAIGNLSHCRIVAHVHDEIIIESEDGITLDMVCQKMGDQPPWAKGLLLGADGYECLFYKKD
ncbi:MAG: DNA polymerase [Eubacteriales bacterium]